MPTIGSSFVRAAWAVLRKECRSEWRTRDSLTASALFVVTTLAAVSLAVGRLGDRSDVLAALLWTVLLFAALASLHQAFVREIEAGTMTFLRLAAPAGAIAAGKLAFNLLLLVVLEVIAVPLFLLLMGAPPPQWGPFLAVLGLGSLALAAATTLVGAVAAQARGRGPLFAGAALPLLLPVLAAAVSGTRAQWAHAGVGGELRLLGAYAAAVLGASVLLYDHLWEE